MKWMWSVAGWGSPPSIGCGLWQAGAALHLLGVVCGRLGQPSIRWVWSLAGWGSPPSVGCGLWQVGAAPPSVGCGLWQVGAALHLLGVVCSRLGQPSICWVWSVAGWGSPPICWVWSVAGWGSPPSVGRGLWQVGAALHRLLPDFAYHRMVQYLSVGRHSRAINSFEFDSISRAIVLI